nr:MAG TPA: hypothetical protein [Caudoviricetes sp.]DAX32273.1 MAG TPA: hypothetical protein [Caudoviricetes sp.]
MRITVLQNQILLYIPRVLIPHALIHLHQKILQMIVPSIQRKQTIPIQAKH